MRTMLTMQNIFEIITSNIAHSVDMRFTVFSNFSKLLGFFCRFWLFRHFFCGDVPHGNYGKHILNHHFQHCAHSVYEIWSVFKYLEIAAYLAQSGFYEISTPLMRTMLPMVNVDQIMISEHCAHCVYEIYIVFKPFEIAVCSAHFEFLEISTPVMRIMLTMANIV